MNEAVQSIVDDVGLMFFVVLIVAPIIMVLERLTHKQ